MTQITILLSERNYHLFRITSLKFDRLFMIFLFCVSVSVYGCDGSGQSLPAPEDVPEDPAVTEGDPAAIDAAGDPAAADPE